jgi:hypothetical protein
MVKAQGAATAPAKFTRLHLFDQKDARILHGIAVDVRDAASSCLTRRRTSGRCLYSQRNYGVPTEAVYVALIEPYAGEPFITDRALVDIPGNDTDARRATAVRVRTRFGTDDLCFTDGRPEKTRSLSGGVRASGEFAYLSTDERGVRQATLSGGTLLESPGITIRPSAREYRGKLTRVDLLDRTALAEGMPAHAELAGRYVEIGNAKHLGAYQVETLKKTAAGTELRLKRGLEIMRAQVLEADYDAGRLRTNIAMLRCRGRDDGLIATNGDVSKRWRVTFEGGNRHEGFWFKLHGEPVTAADFPVTGRFSVWEFGAGDEVSMRTGVSLKRVEANEWTVSATVAFTVAMGENALQWSSDGSSWRDVRGPLGVGAGTPLEFHLRVKK